ncbi:hypothetical protein LTS18_006296, partial [Coniosporium uncinatum]
TDPDGDLTAVRDFTEDNTIRRAWISFTDEERRFNEQGNGGPGANPTPISTTEAFLFVPLVYVNSRPTANEALFSDRGLGLISIHATPSGPLATRHGSTIIPGEQIAYGNFAALIGCTTPKSLPDCPPTSDPTVFLFGMDLHGLQLANATLSTLSNFSAYSFFDAKTSTWSSHPHEPEMTDESAVYLPGTYTSGSIFFSPYFRTFLLVHMNHDADNKIYIRYLDPRSPRTPPPPSSSLPASSTGAASQAPPAPPPPPDLTPETLSALTHYNWSSPQTLHTTTPPSKSFNYAAQAHPEFFNRAYYPPSFGAASPWLGGGTVVAPPHDDDSADGKHLLLSWTVSAEQGRYGVQMARVEFDTLPQGSGFWNGGGDGGGGDGEGGGGKGEGGKKSGAGTTCGSGRGVGWKMLYLLPLWVLTYNLSRAAR